MAKGTLGAALTASFETLRDEETSQGEDGLSARPFLFCVLDCERPSSGEARVDGVMGDGGAVVMHAPFRAPLAAAARVRLVRHDAVLATFDADTLTLGLPDPRMSTHHAVLDKRERGWVVRDEGSKNGTYVQGVRVNGEAPLDDGAILQVGRTLFLFAASVPAPDSEPPDRLRGPEGLPRLATLLPWFARDLERVRKVARSLVPVVVLGESGTGKELVAQSLHELSGRRGQFVPVNCGALPPNLVEGQLFGHVKGAFSGATTNSIGLVRAADRGTLFLDEIGDLPLMAQASLLRVLQEQEVLPVGATRAVRVDVRIVAATHRDLPALVSSGGFREDLFARLSGLRIVAPPLRERRADIGLIVDQLVRTRKYAIERLSPAAGFELLRRDWPLNVRELDKALALAAALGSGRIEVEHIAAAPVRAAAVDDDQLLEARLTKLLREHRGNVSAVARTMGKARTQIQRWIKRFGLEPRDFAG